MPVGYERKRVGRAHQLYQAMLGSFADLLRDKHLLLVPSGPLTILPFQVLVTSPPASGDYRSAAWLTRSHALTVLPAVSSLKALRTIGRPSRASRTMIGFGNPLLDGDQLHSRDGIYYTRQAQLARERQRCSGVLHQNVVTQQVGRGGIAPIASRGGLADLAHLKMQTPLPETADELCSVARDLGAAEDDVRLGMRATEHEIKALSASGALAQYRLVHFATHGALAGDVEGSAEPGLILTPPGTSTIEDDGYLTASEVADLKLDADLVILSACNTAGAVQSPFGIRTEALSGLSQAFFYAQARALLVSHWQVNSEAAVKIITTTVGTMSQDLTVGRAEALRRSMLALIDAGNAMESHPSYWAPFVVVGEGAAR
jgi:CHAT domain-containing protein